MPIRIGTSQERRIKLEKELSRIVPIIIEMNVEKIILFGSLPLNNIHRASDIDLVIVKNTDEKFIKRIDEFYESINPNVALDILVYTPDEFEKMKETNIFIKDVLKKGKILYEKTEQ